MSNPVPDITVLAPVASWSAFIASIVSHFGSTSTKFTLVDDSFDAALIAPVKIGEDWDIRFYGPSRLVTIDPLGGRTDSASSAGSAQLSPVKGTFLGIGADSNFTIVEFEGAVIFLGKKTTGGFYFGSQIGRVLTPCHPTDAERGMTGLAVIGAQPDTYPQWGWLSSTTPDSVNANLNAPDYWTVQEGLTTASWVVAWPGHKGILAPTEAECTVAGVRSPVPLWYGEWYNTRPTAVMNYLYTWWETNPPGTIITDDNGDNFMHVWTDTTSEHLVVPWDASTAP